MTKSLFNEEEKKYIVENIKGQYARDFIQKFNEKFNRNISILQIQRYKKNHKIKCNCPKYNVGEENAKKKRLPIGSVTKRNDGKLYIKVENPRTWKPYQVYLYEKYIGEVPHGMTVTFLDGNEYNFELNNLCLVRPKDALLAGHLGLYFKDKELTRTGLIIASLRNKTAERRKDVRGN